MRIAQLGASGCRGPFSGDLRPADMMNEEYYPRVLVVNGGPFERRSNHGIVMSSLFQGWPKDRLAQIDFSQVSDPEFDVCENYWRVTRNLLGNPVSGVMPLSQNRELCGNREERRESRDLRSPIEHWLRKKISSSQVRTLLNEACYRMPSVLSPNLRSWIDRFRPDVAFTMTGSGALLFKNLKVGKIWNIPCMPYFTDDWITWLYRDHFLAFWLRASLLRLFKEYLSHSPVRITASNEMADEYHSRYGGRFLPVLYPYDQPPNVEATLPRDPSGRLRFIYLGGFEPDRWRSLQMLGWALAKLNEEGVHAELLIYAFPHDIRNYGEKVSIAPVSKIVGTATPAEVPGIQQSADVLVHVESFNPEAIVKTGLSFSTKIPQYLFNKKCILAFGPAKVASMHHLAATQSALTITENDPQRLVDELRKLISDSGLRERYAEHALQVALENHQGDRQRNRLRYALVEACRLWRSSHYSVKGRLQQYPP
jgi:glycosyltransferase involved in cell wall biosynthesis